MQEKVEIITNHFEHYWTKIPKNGYCAQEVSEVTKVKMKKILCENPKITNFVLQTCNIPHSKEAS